MQETGLNSRQRAEAALALAMLPIGGTLFVLCGLAIPVLAILAVVAAARGALPIAAWCAAAALVACWNAVRGIEVMSAFDWRPLPAVLLRSALLIGAYPGWWT